MYIVHLLGYPLVEMKRASSETSETASDQIEVEDHDRNNNEPKCSVKPFSANSRATALVVGTTEKLYVTHVVSPIEIYCVKDKEKFYKFYKKIGKKAEGLSPNWFIPVSRALVFVQGSDGIWYRYNCQLRVLNVKQKRLNTFIAEGKFSRAMGP